MNKSVEKRRESRQFYDKIFTGKTREQGIEYIANNVPNNKLSRAVMASFIANCGNESDKVWLNTVFMVQAYNVVEGEQIYVQKVGKKLFLEHIGIKLASQKDTFDEFADLRVAAPAAPAPKAKKE